MDPQPNETYSDLTTMIDQQHYIALAAIVAFLLVGVVIIFRWEDVPSISVSQAEGTRRTCEMMEISVVECK